MLGGGSKLVSCSLSGKQPLTRCYASQFNRYFLNDELRSVTRFAIKSQYTDILNDPEIHAKDSGFSVCCLGTGSGLANLARGNAATALRINGKVFLFDVGEATQRQLMKSTMTVGQVTRIFSLLLNLNQTSPHYTIQVYGPVGIFNFISMNLGLSGAVISNITIEVFELMGGSKRVWQNPAGLQSYSEYSNKRILRRVIPQNPDGTWTIESIPVYKTPDDALQQIDKGFYDIMAAEVFHVPKMRCFGYVFREKAPDRQIDPEKAISLGVNPGKKFQLLKSGFTVKADGKDKDVRPDEVLLGSERKGRSAAIVGDCFQVSAQMAKLCEGVDVLVHEATLSAEDRGEKVEYGGHSTPTNAGRFANQVGASILVLTHLPSMLLDYEAVGKHYSQAKASISGKTRVAIAYDFLEVMVPRFGFTDSHNEAD